MKKKTNKVGQSTVAKLTIMAHKKSICKTTPHTIYPDKTTGSEVAASVRKDANRWNEEKRADLFERGMQIIYGGTGTKAKVRS